MSPHTTIQAYSRKSQAHLDPLLETLKHLDPKPVALVAELKVEAHGGIPLQGKAACRSHLPQTIMARGVATNASAGDQARPRS